MERLLTGTPQEGQRTGVPSGLPHVAMAATVGAAQNQANNKRLSPHRSSCQLPVTLPAGFEDEAGLRRTCGLWGPVGMEGEISGVYLWSF